MASRSLVVLAVLPIVAGCNSSPSAPSSPYQPTTGPDATSSTPGIEGAVCVSDAWCQEGLRCIGGFCGRLQDGGTEQPRQDGGSGLASVDAGDAAARLAECFAAAAYGPTSFQGTPSYLSDSDGYDYLATETADAPYEQLLEVALWPLHADSKTVGVFNLAEEPLSLATCERCVLIQADDGTNNKRYMAASGTLSIVEATPERISGSVENARLVEVLIDTQLVTTPVPDGCTISIPQLTFQYPANCISESDEAFCARNNNNCGVVARSDNCGRPRSIDCGACPVGLACSDAGACVCIPSCSNRVCGSDGCGGNCAPNSCPSNTWCDSESGTCACAPDCTGKDCGDDGCGGTCGACSAGQYCAGGKCKKECGLCLGNWTDCNMACAVTFGSPSGVCPNPASTDPGACCGCAPPLDCTRCVAGTCDNACKAMGWTYGFCAADKSTNPGACCGCIGCTPKCAGKNCGPDGCGGTCGTCGSNQWCNNGVCERPCSACLGAFPDCAAACKAAFNSPSGACPNPASTDPGRCCACAPCVPKCPSGYCGSDGCGGTCGCPGGRTCVNNSCLCSAYGEQCYSNADCACKSGGVQCCPPGSGPSANRCQCTPSPCHSKTSCVSMESKRTGIMGCGGELTGYFDNRCGETVQCHYCIASGGRYTDCGHVRIPVGRSGGAGAGLWSCGQPAGAQYVARCAALSDPFSCIDF